MKRMGIAFAAAIIAAFRIGGADAADFPSAPPPPPPAWSGFYLHVGPAGLILNDGAKIKAAGAPFPGASVTIDPHFTIAAEIGYYFTPNLAVSFTGGFPPTVEVKGKGVIAGLGRLGEATYGPTTLTAHWHFTDFGRFRPYVGLGPTFMFSFDTKDGALTNLKLDHAVGFAVQAGFELMLDETSHWGWFFDVKKAYLRANATGNLGLIPTKSRVVMDPLVIHSGIAYRF